MGFENYVNHDIKVFHHYRTKRPYKCTFDPVDFNSLYLARTYFGQPYQMLTEEAICAKRPKARELIAELDTPEMATIIEAQQSKFTRSIEDWLEEFDVELQPFKQDIELAKNQ